MGQGVGPHGARGGIVGDHGNDKVGIGDGFVRLGRHLGAGLAQGDRAHRIAIIDRDVEAGLDQAQRHAAAHDAEAEKCDFHGALL